MGQSTKSLRDSLRCWAAYLSTSYGSRSSMAGKKPCREDRGVRQPHPGQEFPMSIGVVSPLRQRMIEDMTARKLSAGTQRLHISSCKRFAAFLQR